MQHSFVGLGVVLVDVLTRQDGGYVSEPDLSEETRLSQKQIRRVLKYLSDAGLVRSEAVKYSHAVAAQASDDPEVAGRRRTETRTYWALDYPRAKDVVRLRLTLMREWLRKRVRGDGVPGGNRGAHGTGSAAGACENGAAVGRAQAPSGLCSSADAFVWGEVRGPQAFVGIRRHSRPPGPLSGTAHRRRTRTPCRCMSARAAARSIRRWTPSACSTRSGCEGWAGCGGGPCDEGTSAGAHRPPAERSGWGPPGSIGNGGPCTQAWALSPPAPPPLRIDWVQGVFSCEECRTELVQQSEMGGGS